jgi:hypothetical protein
MKCERCHREGLGCVCAKMPLSPDGRELKKYFTKLVEKHGRGTNLAIDFKSAFPTWTTERLKRALDEMKAKGWLNLERMQ